MDRQLYGVQYLRALAALMVLSLHAFKFDSFPFSMAGTGVDLFFVISGFLMVAITNNTATPSSFLVDRIRRIVPLYWIITTIMILLYWGGISRQTPIPFWYVSNYISDVPTELIAASYAFVPWWNPGADRSYPILSAGWTLNLEMMFYCLFALTLNLPRKWQLPSISIILFSLAIAGMVKAFRNPTFVGWSNPVIIEFVIGAWIGFLWQNRLKMVRPFGLAACCMVAFAAITTMFFQIELGMLRFLMAIPYGALLIWVLHLEDRPAAISRHEFPLLLGNASYAIYLVQFIPIAILDMNDFPRGLVFAGIVILASVILGLATHKYLEKPIMGRLGRRPSL